MEPPPLKLSRHAEQRMRQRGIPLVAIETIVRFGTARYSAGAKSYAMNQRGRDRARLVMGEDQFSLVADRLNCYVVVKDSMVITIGHRLRRFKRA